MTVRVSCISGSRSPQPVKSNKGISTSISQSNFRLNPILLLNRSLLKKNLIQKGNETAKKYVRFSLRLLCNRRTQYNISRLVLQELRKACGAGFLIMINYIYNHKLLLSLYCN